VFSRRFSTEQSLSGFAFFSVECPLGSNGCEGGPLGQRTRPWNALLGDSTVIDFANGFAYSVDAIHIQSGENAPSEGDRLYEFDGREYSMFPSALTANYIAPDDHIAVELILFTLDGRTTDGGENGPSINAAISVLAFDDDEEFTSGVWAFDCFSIVNIEDFVANVRRPEQGHLVGHLEIFPAVVSADDTNENSPDTGDSNGARRRMVHGWIVHYIAAGSAGLGPSLPPPGGMVAGPFPELGGAMASHGAWGRTLVQGTMPLTAVGDDTPAFWNGPPPL
jgi:hypothetical protein